MEEPTTAIVQDGNAVTKAIVRWRSVPNVALSAALHSKKSGKLNTTIVTEDIPATAQAAADHPVSGSEVLEILQPTVYVPPRKPRPRSTSEPPKRNSIQLLVDEEPRERGHHYFNGLHTAASSTSKLYRDSMLTVHRAHVARTEAMNMLEGRPRELADPSSSLLKASGWRLEQKPLPPNPCVGRFETVSEQAAEAHGRVPSSQIFDYMSKLG